MKIVCCLVMLLGLAACVAEQKTGTGLAQYNRQTLEAFVHVQKTRPADILAKLGDPASQGVYSDGRSSLIYNSVSDVSSGAQGRSPGQIKMASFIFDRNGVLEEWKYDENLRSIQRSKFTNVMDAGNAEIQKQGAMISVQYDELQPGVQSGRVFATVGKPFHAQDEGAYEKWIYKDADDSNRHYYFYFKNNILAKKYWIRTSPYVK